jgi:hypothetical protein
MASSLARCGTLDNSHIEPFILSLPLRLIFTVAYHPKEYVRRQFSGVQAPAFAQTAYCTTAPEFPVSRPSDVGRSSAGGFLSS